MTEPKSCEGVTKELLLIRPGKWDLVVIASLKNGPVRFNTLKSEIGEISQKMLSSTLRELERNGFVSRTQYASIPPRVEYELTQLGIDFMDNVEAWVQFARTNHLAIESAREAFDRQHRAGVAEQKYVG